MLKVDIEIVVLNNVCIVVRGDSSVITIGAEDYRAWRLRLGELIGASSVFIFALETLFAHFPIFT